LNRCTIITNAKFFYLLRLTPSLTILRLEFSNSPPLLGRHDLLGLVELGPLLGI